VAIDVPASEHDCGASAEPCLHIGHARTVLLGSLIAQELGLPLDIRLDGVRAPGRSHEAAVLISLCEIVSRLKIDCRRVYWIAQKPAAACEYEWELGKKGAATRARLREVLGAVTPLIALVEDDLLFHYPSLMIRGMEFFDTDIAPTGTSELYMVLQREGYKAAGREMHEVNVPLITAERRKLSKSLGTGLTWELFTRFPGQVLRDWLVATALDPTNPQSALGVPFNWRKMSTRPYEWSWDNWDKYLRTRR
jgi:hypothetical protein